MKNESRGYLWITASAFFYSTYGVWSKLMTQSFDEFSQAWSRVLIILIVLLPLLIIKNKWKKIKKEHAKWLLLMFLPGGLNQAPLFYGFQHLSIGTATLLFYLSLTSAVFILGKFFFFEKITWPKQASFLLAAIGLSIIYKFELSFSQIIPALIMMLAGMMGATFVVISKKVSNYYSELQLITMLSFFVLFGNMIASLLMKSVVLPDTNHIGAWVPQILYTICYLMANSSVVKGFGLIKQPGVGGLIGLSEVIFAAILGVIFFAEQVTLGLLVGGGLILLAAALPDTIKLLKLQHRH